MDKTNQTTNCNGAESGAAERVAQALDSLAAQARAHSRAGQKKAVTATGHERSCAEVCRSVVRHHEQLTPDERQLVVSEAVGRKILAAGSRADDVTRLTRIACGSREDKSVVSRIAAVARHIINEKRDLDTILPAGAAFWRIYEDLRPAFTTSRRKRPAPPVLLRLAAATLAQIQAGAAVTVRITWDPATKRPMIDGVSDEVTLAEGPASTDGEPECRTAAEPQGDQEGIAAVERTDELPGLEVRASAETALAGQEEAAVDTNGSPQADLEDTAAGHLEVPAERSISFTAHVRRADPSAFALLQTHGQFKRTSTDGKTAWIWLGREFDGLDAIIVDHGGREVEAPVHQ